MGPLDGTAKAETNKHFIELLFSAFDKMADPDLDQDGTSKTAVPASSEGTTSVPNLHRQQQQQRRGEAHSSKRAVVSDDVPTDEPQKKRAKVSSEEQWNGMLERLRLFREEHGHANVPKRYPADPQLYVTSAGGTNVF